MTAHVQGFLKLTQLAFAAWLLCVPSSDAFEGLGIGLFWMMSVTIQY